MACDAGRVSSGARRRAALLGSLAALAIAGPAVAAPGAGAASLEPGGSFNELVQREPEATRTQTTTNTNASSEPTNSKTILLIALGAAVLVLSGIAYVIVRDARRMAPADNEDLSEARVARDTAVVIRKRRAKAKAARQQRKRNR